jgi:hypothetical protein
VTLANRGLIIGAEMREMHDAFFRRNAWIDPDCHHDPCSRDGGRSQGELGPKGPRAARPTVMLRTPGDQDTCIRLPGQGAMSTPGARGLGGEERRAA